MRILYVDIDSLRPDHLGCYGYHRNTSPNIDRIAARATRFDNNYITDGPCLPSRTALWTGRCGIHTGVINHVGAAADPFPEGAYRGFRSTLGRTNWMTCLRDLGHTTATISPFGERHSAWHWYAGFSEIFNTGKRGSETADEVAPLAIDWLKKNGRNENWFLHVNFWDPHTGYRTPLAYGEPFANDPLPAWLTDDIRRQHWQGVGPHSAQEVSGWNDQPYSDPALGHPTYPRQPWKADSMREVRKMFDGYDTAVHFADQHLGHILNTLADQNILDDTVIIISADHGEKLGELNVYGDHMFADQITARVPLIIHWPGITPTARVDAAFHYHLDMPATMLELLGGAVPANWDGLSYASGFRTGQAQGREHLVTSHGAWSCQRAVRFDDYLAIRNYHDGYHLLPEHLLFNVKNDPHEQHNLAEQRPDLVTRALTLLDNWQAEMLKTATHDLDPMWTVLREGGPGQVRGYLKNYVARLRATGRAHWAEQLMARHPGECQ